MNLTDKARRGSQEAMEALFDMTKNDVAYLCRLLLGDNQAASVAVPRIYRSLWGAGARRAHHHRGGLRPGRPGENSGFLQNRPRQKGLQVLPHPAKPGFRSGDGGGAAVPPRGALGAGRGQPAAAAPVPLCAAGAVRVYPGTAGQTVPHQRGNGAPGPSGRKPFA